MERPRRPLSAYNLFYRFKRAKILESQNKGDGSKETIKQLIMVPSGLEDQPSAESTMLPDRLNELRRMKIQSVLRENLSPKDTTKRSHRKSKGNGCLLTFVEMNEIIGASWKSIDSFSKSVYEELAEEGRRTYRKRVAEYELKSPSSPLKKTKSSTELLTPKKSKRRKVSKDEPPSKNKDASQSSPAKDAKLQTSQGASPLTPDLQTVKQVNSEHEDASSIYDLFYHYKRMKIFEAKDKGILSKYSINALIMAIPGLEDYPSGATEKMSPKQLKELRRATIRLALHGNLDSQESHHKSRDGEIDEAMLARWKSVDDYTKFVLKELVEEGRRLRPKLVGQDRAKLSLDPEEEKIESCSSNHIPQRTQSTELHFGMPTTLEGNDFNVHYNSNGYNISPTLSPTAPMSMDGLDPMIRTLPMFPDIFGEEEEEEDSSDDGPDLLDFDYSDFSEAAFSPGTQLSNERMDNPPCTTNLYVEGKEAKKGETTVDDFMQLIAMLDENLSG